MNARTLSLRGSLLAVAMSVVVVVPAAAHPFFTEGAEAPVDSLASVTLDLAHGCGSEEEGTGEDTTEVALEVPDWMRVVEVPEPDGWRVDLDHSADGSHVEVVTWATDDPQEPAPTFDLDIVVTGEVGEVRYVGVFQACGDTAYRWVGTPDDPADDPAIRLTLVEPDPAAPPPPPPPPPAPEPDAEAPDPDPDVQPDPGPVDEPETLEDDAPQAEAAASADEGGGTALPWIVGLVMLVAAAAILGLRSRGRSAEDGSP